MCGSHTATKRVTAVDVQRAGGVECGRGVIILYLYCVHNVTHALQTCSGRWCAHMSHELLL